MAALINPLTPMEMQIQQQAIDRQRKIAEYLQQQSLTPSEGQMVSGRYVAPSMTQYLAKLAQGLIGKTQQESLDKKQMDLATTQGDMLRGQFGIGGNTAQQPTTQGASTPEPPRMPLGTGMSGINTGGIAGNDKLAAALLSNPQSMPAQNSSPSPAYGSRVIPGMNPIQAFQLYASDPKTYDAAYLKQFDPTDMQRNNKYLGISPEEAAIAERAKNKKAGFMEFQPGNMAVDLSTGQRIVAPDFKSGTQGGFDASGNPIMASIPGSGILAQMEGDKARAISAAQSGYKTQTVNKPSGPVVMTDQQIINEANGGGGSASGVQGLDLSKLTPQEIQALQKQNPEAFVRGTADFANTSSGVGVPLQSDAQKKFAEAQAGNAATASAALNERVRTGEDLMSRLAESREAMKNFQAGGGKETRLKVAQMAQAIGMPDSTINKIAGGDIAAMQEFQKLAVSQAMESLKQTMATDNGLGGRMTQAEFQQFLKVNPNLSTDPRAIEKLYSFSERVHDRNLNEQQAFDAYTTQGGDPARWPAEWARRMNQKLQPNMPIASEPATPTSQSSSGLSQSEKQELDQLRQRFGRK